MNVIKDLIIKMFSFSFERVIYVSFSASQNQLFTMQKAISLILKISQCIELKKSILSLVFWNNSYIPVPNEALTPKNTFFGFHFLCG